MGLARVRVRSGQAARLARRGRRGASTSLACAARARPAPVQCIQQRSCTPARLHHVCTARAHGMCSACADLHHEHAALRVEHDAAHADLREGVPGTGARPGACTPCARARACTPCACACACTPCACACIGRIGWHERWQALARGGAVADLGEGVPGQGRWLSLWQPARQLQVVRRGVVVLEARADSRAHEAVRPAAQPQPDAALARGVSALERRVQLRHEGAQLELAALPHAHLDAAVPVLAH